MASEHAIEEQATPSQLTHLDSQGRAAMVDVGDKPITERVAVAQGSVTMAAATLKAVVPEHWLGFAADNPVISVLALAALAVLLSICSEADAFVAASLTQFSLTSRLAFLVVGPMIDLKLFAMQTATFGRAFALRFAPATFALAILVSALVGAVLL